MDMEAEAIERIGAAIQSLRQRDHTHGRDSAPLRLYRTRDGGFVRVLDDDTAPLTPEMLRAIDRYTQHGSGTGALAKEEEDAAMHEESSIDGEPKVERAEMAPPPPGNTESETRRSEHPADSLTLTTAHSVVVDGGEEIAAAKSDVAMQDTTEDPEPPAPVVEKETPGSLATAGVDVGMWLSGQSSDAQETATEGGINGYDDIAPQPPQAPSFDPTKTGDPIEMLMLRWPRQISERTRLCYSATQGPSSPPRCVVYWLRTTLRVGQGNFSLAAALELGKHYQLPVVGIYLTPSSIMYPVRHASGINDALTRWSIAEVRTRLREDLNVELFAFMPQDASTAPSVDSGSALYMLLDAFQPAAVITDDGFSLAARAEVESLRQFLHTRVRTPWSLLAVDSMTCVPFQSLSESVQKSLRIDTASHLSEEEFATEYSALVQHRERFSTSLNRAQPTPSYQASIRVAINDALQAAMTKSRVEMILWDVVEAMNMQSANSISAASEHAALKRLESLVTVIDDRPAIQQELQGSGIMSLVPFMRHGSIFSGYVLDKLAEVIASRPRPTDAKSRKAFATLKVLRSRASSHLAKERDYGLYLSLWATRRLERELQLSGRVVSFRAIASFKTDLAELDTYKQVLPTWISTNRDLGGSLGQTPVYDPYQLESGRTDDQYWNEIQLFLIEHHYVHPLVMLYWTYRILQWSISTRAGIATIEALLDKCSLGSTHSPDASFSVWTSLFRIGKAPLDPTEVTFVERVEAELSAQPRLQFRK